MVPRTHIEQLSCSKGVEFWSVLAARLRELSVLRERNVGLGQQAHLVRFIVHHVEGRARVQEIVEWQVTVASIWIDTYLAIMIVVGDASAQLVIAQRAAAVEKRASLSLSGLARRVPQEGSWRCT